MDLNLVGGQPNVAGNEAAGWSRFAFHTSLLLSLSLCRFSFCFVGNQPSSHSGTAKDEKRPAKRPKTVLTNFLDQGAVHFVVSVLKTGGQTRD